MFLSFFRRLFRRRGAPRGVQIDPDEIFLDARNLPRFDPHQFEGRLELPVPRRTVFVTGLVFLSFLLVFLGQSFALQLRDGELYERRSEENRLRHTVLFGERGAIFDRRGSPLAWNEPDPAEREFAKRRYARRRGLAHLVGFLKYPKKDSAGFYYQVDFEGMAGIEKYFNEYIAPSHGLKIVETNARGALTSESVLRKARDGASVTATIDARVSEALYDRMASLARERGFAGGAGVIMDVANGDILALASFPEYDSQILTNGDDSAAIQSFVLDERKPFLNRVTGGLYTPGSIVKPFLALAALEEGVITPEKQIISTGSLSVQNPYDPGRPTVFKDWKAHGAVNMRQAIAVSSDVYFYEIGGGFEKQAGLGIGNIEKYMRLFGFGEEPGGNDFFGEAGVIPSPEWKLQNFGEEWRLGNTYHTAIGQYGFQVTPLQAVRAAAALANGGRILLPRVIVEDEEPFFETIPIAESSFRVAREGMRQAVLSGTAAGLNIPEVTVAAKTGTAELGTMKRFVHSWVIGFFPYEKPRFAFAIVMERGPRGNTVGALYAARQLLEWMGAYAPEYLSAATE
jgi:penicillin-binding protein 2